ncbi:hypothetical protein BD410DRAFT_464514 [Rickenella mellea]|uniref:Required for respiratory growth protein 9, mitochondrial n=1 Tax=Rickenella mellea TaxID=50990 RepID=A0A4Y7PTM0_9AGAM|nr:hypothetical protein BD410DRAFT_464514 [Rickenella mellea]
MFGGRVAHHIAALCSVGSCYRGIATHNCLWNKWATRSLVLPPSPSLAKINPELEPAASSSSRVIQRGKSEEYRKYRQKMKDDFPDGWNPPRKLSREAMDGIRALHAHDPAQFNTPALSEKFCVSPEAIRRILRSKWTPTQDERAKLLQRERMRKQANIGKSIERERSESLARIEKLRQQGKERRLERDPVTPRQRPR